jgi:CxxC-x17-CxxC domain-containing protein
MAALIWAGCSVSRTRRLARTGRVRGDWESTGRVYPRGRRAWYNRILQAYSSRACSLGSLLLRCTKVLVPLESFDVDYLSVPSRGIRLRQQKESGMSDRTLTCRDCGQAFVFTFGEQSFYQERGYTEPQRCPSCRAARKSQRTDDGYSRGGGSSYSSGSGNYGGGGGGYSAGPREMHPATCSSCGKQTEVPFQPTAGKPVYCRECFAEQRASRPSYGRY